MLHNLHYSEQKCITLVSESIAIRPFRPKTERWILSGTYRKRFVLIWCSLLLFVQNLSLKLWRCIPSSAQTGRNTDDGSREELEKRKRRVTFPPICLHTGCCFRAITLKENSTDTEWPLSGSQKDTISFSLQQRVCEICCRVMAVSQGHVSIGYLFWQILSDSILRQHSEVLKSDIYVNKAFRIIKGIAAKPWAIFKVSD